MADTSSKGTQVQGSKYGQKYNTCQELCSPNMTASVEMVSFFVIGYKSRRTSGDQATVATWPRDSTGWSTQEPQNSSAVLFSRCTARLGILSTDLDSSEQAALGEVAIFCSKSPWLFQFNRL